MGILKHNTIFCSLVLTLGILATGCQSKADIEPIDIEKIPLGFGSPSSETTEDTKATATLKGSDLFTTPGTTFAVWANWSVPDPNIDGAYNSAEILKKQVVTSVDSDSDGVADQWTYSPLQYWHKSGFYDFRGIYPSDVSTISSSNGKTVAVNYSMHTDDYDLMAAYCQRDMDDFDITDPDNNQYVNLTFRHALSAICFKFQTGEDKSGYYLTSFYLSNLLTVGTFLYDTEANETDTPAPDFHDVLTKEWYFGENEQSYYRADKVFNWSASTKTEYVYIPEAYSSSENWEFAIPQKVAGNSTYNIAAPSVTFTVYNSATDKEVTTTISLPEAQWEAGKKYIYYIQAQASKSTITVKVTDWDEYKVVCDDISFK